MGRLIDENGTLVVGKEVIRVIMEYFSGMTIDKKCPLISCMGIEKGGGR